MTAPINGLDLSEGLYMGAVRPILDARFPALRYSAGRLGSGSDVLGFDDEISRDHDWGPQVQLFIEESRWDLRQSMVDALSEDLPAEILGYPARFIEHDDRTRSMSADDPDARHGVTVTTAARFFQETAAIDGSRPLEVRDWLRVPSQVLRTITAGRLFRDDLGIQRLRDQLAWYPHDVWLYLMASQWRRIEQEAPFVGRTDNAGDLVGSTVVAGRHVIELMRLCFLIEREYPPYFKWFGTAFSGLSCAARLEPLLLGVIGARNWSERQGHLTSAYTVLGEMHDDLDVAPVVDPPVSAFHGRPYVVANAEPRIAALSEAITSPEVRSLPPGLGAIWQFVDSSDILSSPDRWEPLTSIYAG